LPVPDTTGEADPIGRVKPPITALAINNPIKQMNSRLMSDQQNQN
jgi:hypothetical protein